MQYSQKWNLKLSKYLFYSRHFPNHPKSGFLWKLDCSLSCFPIGNTNFAICIMQGLLWSMHAVLRLVICGRVVDHVSCPLSTSIAQGLFKWRIDFMSKSYGFSLLPQHPPYQEDESGLQHKALEVWAVCSVSGASTENANQLSIQ